MDTFKQMNKLPESFIIRLAEEKDVENIAKVHSEVFSRQTNSHEWISCNFRAFPRIRYFVAELETEIVGYIQWTEKSGFRKEVVIELEQIAVLPSKQGKKIGTALIKQSLPLIKESLAKRQAHIKHILVTTRADNHAQQLYAKILNAKVETRISNLFSSDEVLMIARNVNIGHLP